MVEWCPQHGYPLPCAKCGYDTKPVICSRCHKEIYTVKKCPHTETEVYEWETSKAFIKDIRCKKCLFVLNREVKQKE